MPKKRVKANHEYKITFGVKQTEQVSKAANIANKTPHDFITGATLKHAENITNPVK